jgi:hypothetical protein
MGTNRTSGVGRLRVGDQVQLTSIPLGRGKRLRVGLVGEVVCVGAGPAGCYSAPAWA